MATDPKDTTKIATKEAVTPEDLQRDATEFVNKDKKLHISYEERAKWDKLYVDFHAHLGAGGVTNHALGNGTTPGFSMNDFTNELKSKLDGIQEGALNNPYPGHIPFSDVTGLSTVGHTGEYKDLLGVPETFTAGGGNSDTVGGITITVNNNGQAPTNPKSLQNVWFDMKDKLIKVYVGSAWVAMCAVYA